MRIQVLVMPLPGKEMEANAVLYTSSTSAALLCVTACNEAVNQSTNLALLVVAHFAMPSRVDHTRNIRDRNTCLGHIRCEHNLAHALWGRRKRGRLLV